MAKKQKVAPVPPPPEYRPVKLDLELIEKFDGHCLRQYPRLKAAMPKHDVSLVFQMDDSRMFRGCLAVFEISTVSNPSYAYLELTSGEKNFDGIICVMERLTVYLNPFVTDMRVISKTWGVALPGNATEFSLAGGMEIGVVMAMDYIARMNRQ